MSRKNRNRLLAYAAIVLAATAIGWFVSQSSMGEQLELRTYDYRFRLKGIFPEPALTPITILGIDDHSLEHIPDPLMLWHRHFAEVLNGLVAGDAGAVGIDIVFSAIDKFDADGERALARALIQTGNAGVPVVLAYRVRAEGVEQPPPAVMQPALNIGHTFGYANLTSDPDDFVRRQTFRQIAVDGTESPSLAFAVASAYAKRKGQALAVPAGSQILINYKARGAFPRVSFYDALEAVRNGNTAFLKNNFGGRIVLIARMSGRGGDDLHSTPLYYWGADSPEGLRTPGVEIHANMISTLLENRPVVAFSASENVRVAGLIAFVITFLWGYFRLRFALSATVLILAGFMTFVIVEFLQGVWVWTIAPFSSAGAALVLTLGANYAFEGKEKRRIRTLFKGYVSDAVISQLLEKPDGLVLSGERRRIAVLFADIKGFTTMSEKSDPERVVHLLNRYFGSIVGVIQANHGTVNCLMGDGIMVTFGAPIKDDDAALHSVQAAQAMMRTLGKVNEQLKAEGFQPIEIGIGINAGEAIIGNMGSPQKMEYTTIGDVVNAASRIEGKTRSIPDADILISQSAYDWVAGRMPAESVGNTSLKGKDVPVALYRVLWK